MKEPYLILDSAPLSDHSSIDIVLPCYNPQKGWSAAVVKGLNGLRTALPEDSFHLILVNDGSENDFFLQELEQLKAAELGANIISYSPNKGKGYALRTGVAGSRAEYIIYTDIDFPYTIDGMAKAIEVLKSGTTDIIAGIRSQEYYEQYPSDRKIISRLLKWLIKNMLGLKVNDTQCGFKGFNQKGKSIFLSTQIFRFLFDLEFIFLSSKRKDIKITAVPVFLRPDVKFSKVNLGVLLGESFNFISILFRRNTK
jgi:glycosyltransferase involved in cell wall biosynthesis